MKMSMQQRFIVTVSVILSQGAVCTILKIFINVLLAVSNSLLIHALLYDKRASEWKRTK